MSHFKLNSVYFVLSRLSTRGSRRARWGRNGLVGLAFYLVFVIASMKGADSGMVVGTDPSRDSVGAGAAIPFEAHIRVGPGTDRIDRGAQTDDGATLTAADIYASNVGVIVSNLNDIAKLLLCHIIEYFVIGNNTRLTQLKF